jgi:vacuolar protein sorting-associated protein VTA1
MSDDPPVSLKKVKPYLEQAKRFKEADKVVAYHCRLYAMQTAMEIRASIPKEDMGYVLKLMDDLEAEKVALGAFQNPEITVETFAQNLFEKADDADRAGNSTLPVAKDFLAASQILETTAQFGPIPEDVGEKIKYAKWRFVEICKATKERRLPAPPRPLRGDEPEPSQLGRVHVHVNVT